MATIVRMPEVLANASEAALQTWLVKEGDPIAVGQPLAELETEKANVEYNSEVDGTMLRLLVGEGDSVLVGSPIGVIGSAEDSTADVDSLLAGEADNPPVATEASEDAAPTSATPSTGIAPPEPAPSPVSDSASEPPQQSSAAPIAGERRFASPLVRRLARERDIDLGSIVGSGPSGRIVRRDLESATGGAQAAEASPPEASAPAAAASDSGFRDVAHTGMRRAIARRLTESKSTVPHFYLVADCRMDSLLELRAKVNESSARKISVNDFIIKAVAKALVEVPEANVIWTDTASRRFDGVDLAVAVSTDGGLLTPVLRAVEGLSLAQVSSAVSQLAERARAGNLKQHELEGGSFAISNLGMFGVDQFTAIINPPQSGILAVGAAKPRPVVEDGALIVGAMMTVTLSADHRVIDGALGAQWLASFVRFVENPLSILI